MKPETTRLTEVQRCESATNFKGFKDLHNIVLDISDKLLCSNVQTEAGHMDDELQQSFETFQRNVNKLTLNVKRKKFMHSWQITLHDMFKQYSMNPDFCQKKKKAHLTKMRT